MLSLQLLGVQNRLCHSILWALAAENLLEAVGKTSSNSICMKLYGLSSSAHCCLQSFAISYLHFPAKFTVSSSSPDISWIIPQQLSIVAFTSSSSVSEPRPLPCLVSMPVGSEGADSQWSGWFQASLDYKMLQECCFVSPDHRK